MTRAALVTPLAQDLRRRLFGTASGGELRIGAEVEFIPLDRQTGRGCPLDGGGPTSTLGMVRRLAARHGWQEHASYRGGPRFLLPGGGTVSFEPGGQVEFAAPPCASATELLRRLREIAALLAGEMDRNGIDLLSVGLDPVNPVEQAPLQVRSPRYLTMARHFARRGTAGARMMRQTAAFQICLDIPHDPTRTWKVANALAPYLIAMFANSPRASGRLTGHRSFRAWCWRRLDPSRTGLPWSGPDPLTAYLRFALEAPFLDPAGGPARSFGARLRAGGVRGGEWDFHLSTLFPEVRPRGYLEFRSMDSVGPEHYPAPIALVSGLLYDSRALAAADELLGDPDPGLLSVAGRLGLEHPRLAHGAAALVDLALEGCRRLEGFLSPAEREAAAEYFDRYTRRRRSPGDNPLSRSGPPPGRSPPRGPGGRPGPGRHSPAEPAG